MELEEKSTGEREHKQEGARARGSTGRLCLFILSFPQPGSSVTLCTLLSLYPENPNSQDTPGCPVPLANLRSLPLTEFTPRSLEMVAFNDKGKDIRPLVP